MNNIIKRDGSIVPFSIGKITATINKAFMATGEIHTSSIVVYDDGGSAAAITITIGAVTAETEKPDEKPTDPEKKPDEKPDEKPTLIPFTDLKEGDWFYKDVMYAYGIGLINGKTATSFAPNDNLTYAEAVKLAACMYQLHMNGKVTLTNGSPQWYSSYVSYAKTNGIIGKDYDWNAPATRAGYMEIFAKALPNDALPAINTVPDGKIPDVPMTHASAAAIYKLYRAGIVQGVDAARNCNPGANIKRSEVAAILTRMMDKTARVKFNM